eukprot:697616-Rhodomonas_salina.4
MQKQPADVGCIAFLEHVALDRFSHVLQGDLQVIHGRPVCSSRSAWSQCPILEARAPEGVRVTPAGDRPQVHTARIPKSCCRQGNRIRGAVRESDLAEVTYRDGSDRDGQSGLQKFKLSIAPAACPAVNPDSRERGMLQTLGQQHL